MSVCSSTCEYPVFPVPLIEEAVFSLMSIFGTIVKRQAAVAVRVDFWVLFLSHWSTRLILRQYLFLSL